MPKSIADIRYAVEQAVKDSLESMDVLSWCNDAQAELMLYLEIPDTAQIAVNNTDLAYPEPADIRRINRMWLTSERARGFDDDIGKPYRRYAGQIIFEHRFTHDDTLNVDFYRHLKHFATLADTIDLQYRFLPLYASYCQAQYYLLPRVIERIGTQLAQRQHESHYNRHLIIKEQIALDMRQKSQPSMIKEPWR